MPKIVKPGQVIFDRFIQQYEIILEPRKCYVDLRKRRGRTLTEYLYLSRKTDDGIVHKTVIHAQYLAFTHIITKTG